MTGAPTRLGIIGGLVATAVLLMPAAASACCAPVEARIEGPGIASPIVVRAQHGDEPWTPDDPLRQLAEGTGSWNSFQPGEGLREHKPGVNLGAAYTVTFFAGPPGEPAESPGAVVDVYPAAGGGPWTYLREGSSWWPVHGWYQAEATLLTLLRALGVPLPSTQAASSGPQQQMESADNAEPAANIGASPWLLAPVLGAGALLLAAALRRRSRGPGVRPASRRGVADQPPRR